MKKKLLYVLLALLAGGNIHAQLQQDAKGFYLIGTADELVAIRSSEDPTMTFLRLWTRKEAVLKMRGTGIRGFGSMMEVSEANDCTIEEIDCGIADTVAALATAL